MSLLSILACLFHFADVPVTIEFDKNAEGRPTRIVVSGIDEATLIVCKKQMNEEGARVQIAGGSAEELAQRPSLLGVWSVENSRLIFTPRFPFSDHVVLRITVDPARLLDPKSTEGKPVIVDLSTPKKDDKPVTKLVQVYPTRNKLPENQLRFYIQFSGEMSRGEAYKNIKLLDASGKPLNDVFLELEEELWDPGLTRFTLLFDPGRIKQGLKPREDLGPILEEGKSYTLVIRNTWHDAGGRKLAHEDFRKEFRAGPPDDEPIDPKTWKVTAPRSATQEPIEVRFPESLDYALLHRVLWIVDADGKKVSGTIAVLDEETHWEFTPSADWKPGTYRLIADKILEDLAANRIGRKFEVDIVQPTTEKVETKTVEIPFVVK